MLHRSVSTSRTSSATAAAAAAAASVSTTAAAAAAVSKTDEDMVPRWRFGADASRVPRRPAEDPTWDITPELMAAFRQLAETMCPILTRECAAGLVNSSDVEAER